MNVSLQMVVMLAGWLVVPGDCGSGSGCTNRSLINLVDFCKVHNRPLIVGN